MFFSWTFDLLLFEVHISPHKRNIVCEYKLYGKLIVKYQHEFVSDRNKKQTSGTSSDNEWQRMTTSDTCGTTSDNEWCIKWQRVTTSDNEL